jgi:hypothetical protein
VRKAATYRMLLQAALPDVFESFNEVMRSPALGRITAQQVEEVVLGVLKVCQRWKDGLGMRLKKKLLLL